MSRPIKNLSNKSEQWKDWFKETAEQQVLWRGDPPRELRWKSVVGAIAFTFAFGWLGLQLLTSNFHTSDSPIAIVPDKADAITQPTESQTAAGTILEIFSARSFDPLGDNSENDALANLAIDQDLATAWETVRYKNEDLGKEGVGLLLDLGSAQDVSKVELALISAGHDFEVYVSADPEPTRGTTELLGSVKNSAKSEVVSGLAPITGRYVLIWLTLLPQIADEFLGGIENIQVRL
jgi:hypothetical protein